MTQKSHRAQLANRKLFSIGRWWKIYGDTCWGGRWWNNHLLNLSKFKSDFPKLTFFPVAFAPSRRHRESMNFLRCLFRVSSETTQEKKVGEFANWLRSGFFGQESHRPGRKVWKTDPRWNGHLRNCSLRSMRNIAFHLTILNPFRFSAIFKVVNPSF